MQRLSVALLWYHFTREVNQADQTGSEKGQSQSVSVHTGRQPTSVPPRQVHTVKWQIGAPIEVFRDKLYLQIISQRWIMTLRGRGMCSNTGIFSPVYTIYDLCEVTGSHYVSVLVANFGVPVPWEYPTHQTCMCHWSFFWQNTKKFRSLIG